MHLSILITYGDLSSTEKKARAVVLNVLVERVENDGETATAITDLSIKLRLEVRKEIEIEIEIKRINTYSCDHGIQERNNVILAEIGLNIIYHIQHNITL